MIHLVRFQRTYSVYWQIELLRVDDSSKQTTIRVIETREATDTNLGQVSAQLVFDAEKKGVDSIG